MLLLYIILNHPLSDYSNVSALPYIYHCCWVVEHTFLLTHLLRRRKQSFAPYNHTTIGGAWLGAIKFWNENRNRWLPFQPLGWRGFILISIPRRNKNDPIPRNWIQILFNRVKISFQCNGIKRKHLSFLAFHGHVLAPDADIYHRLQWAHIQPSYHLLRRDGSPATTSHNGTIWGDGPHNPDAMVATL